jgi:hypothetical protein
MLARCMDVRKRRIAAIVVGCAMALATLPAVLAGSGQPATAARLGSTNPGGSAPASGEQFAIQVLDQAPIPPGAQPWNAAPPAVLDVPPQTIAIGGLIDLHELYLVDEPAVFGQHSPLESYVLGHLPAGSRIIGGNSGFGPAGSSTGFFASLPASGANENLAQLLYETTANTGGGYVLRIDAQVVWVPDRSGADSIPLPGGAELTGYATLSLANPSSGPVTVELGKADSDRLAAAVDALPLAPRSFCMEDALLFTITFRPPSFSLNPTYSVSEDLCGSTVDVSAGATSLPALSDTGCTLRHLVAALLPAAAAGTRGAVENC